MAVAAKTGSAGLALEHVAGKTDRIAVVVKIAVPDIVRERAGMGLRVVAFPDSAIHVAQEAGGIVSLRVVARGAVLDIPPRQLGVTATPAANRSDPGQPVGTAMPLGANTEVGIGIVTFGAEIAGVQLMAGDAVAVFAASLETV